ncbi:MAG: HD domain-containing phosphohydrolase [bacterium]
MIKIELPHHIHFKDIVQNPYLLDLYHGMSPLLSGAGWWMVDEIWSQGPFPPREDGPLCPLRIPRDTLLPLLKEKGYLVAAPEESNGSAGVVACGEGQGLAGCWYRNQFLGGIGICHVPSSRYPQLQKVIRTVHGYLSLLSGALEDHDDLELVHTVWSETITVVDLEDLLERVMRELCSAISLDGGMILLTNQDGELFPAGVCLYPAGLLKLRNVGVSQMLFQERVPAGSGWIVELEAGDPLRQWLEKELADFQFQTPPDHAICLAVPFYRNLELVGVFISFAARLQSFSDTKMDLIRLLATSGAAALGNALTLQRIEKSRKALSTIHVVHRITNPAVTTKDLLPRIGQLARQLLKVRKCSIMYLDSIQDRLIPVVCLGLEENEVGQKPLPLGVGLPGWVAEHYNPFLYHPGGKLPPPWRTGEERYYEDSYLAVAMIDQDVQGVITVADKEMDFTPGDRDILLTFAEQAVMAIKNACLHEGERTITVNALKSIANLIETQDPGTPGITVQTCLWAQRIARVLNLPEALFQNITYASLLHESGLLGADQQESSFHTVQQKKAELSLRFVQSLGLPKEVGDIVYHVNEAWNGQGFPDGLKGNKIPLGSRIIAVANAFATLLHRWEGEGRPSRHASDKAMRIISRLGRRSYDPDVVNALQQVIENPLDDPSEGMTGWPPA